MKKFILTIFIFICPIFLLSQAAIIPNQGQWDENIKYVIDNKNEKIWISEGKIKYQYTYYDKDNNLTKYHVINSELLNSNTEINLKNMILFIIVISFRAMINLSGKLIFLLIKK